MSIELGAIHLEVLTLQALSVSKARIWPLAITLWTEVKNLAPHNLQAWYMLGAALRETRQLDAADAILAAAAAEFPDDPKVESEYARVTRDRCDWVQAKIRWTKVLQVFPQSAEAWIGLGQALRMSKRFDEADASLQEGMSCLPDNAFIACEHARVARDRGDWVHAKNRWKTALDRFPQSEEVWCGYGDTLLAAGEEASVDAVCIEAKKRLLRSKGIAIIQARAANARSAWSEALQRWESLLSRFPGDSAIVEGFGAAKYGMQMEMAGSHAKEAEISPPNCQPQTNATIDQVTDIRLVEMFESIGENCEFGIMQRRVGSEPLGLLRFAGITSTALIEAINSDFKDVGNPDSTVLSDVLGEHFIHDKRYGIGMHTFIRVGSQDHDAVFTNVCTKLQFLRRKLLEDLEESSKIFVFKVVETLTDDAELQLENALRRHGSAKLLIVRVADSENKAGTLARRSGLTLTGYIERHGLTAAGTWDIPVNGWLALLRSALQEWNRQIGI